MCYTPIEVNLVFECFIHTSEINAIAYYEEMMKYSILWIAQIPCSPEVTAMSKVPGLRDLLECVSCVSLECVALQCLLLDKDKQEVSLCSCCWIN